MTKDKVDEGAKFMRATKPYTGDTVTTLARIRPKYAGANTDHFAAGFHPGKVRSCRDVM